MSKTKNPFGVWDTLTLVKEAKGWIDCCPLWDDDGNAYLVHAWAKSRSGIKHRLTINKLSPDGEKILDDGIAVYEDSLKHPTLEGPKFYKRNGYYYIMAPAGGVKDGWEVVFRSKNVYGPYEDKIVLHQGKTSINGPHQGGWVETPAGESWFIHFQDRDAYGRVVLLEPVKWIDDWLLIGTNYDDNGIGEPVLIYKKPAVDKDYPICVSQTSDEFESEKLGLQWQWEANHSDSWYSLKDNKGQLRLFSQRLESDTSRILGVPNVVDQKFPAPEFIVITKLKFSPAEVGEKVGLIIFGMDYSYLSITKLNERFLLSQTVCINANNNGKEEVIDSKNINSDELFFKVSVSEKGACNFSYSLDGKNFEQIGKEFIARKGIWVGAKVGLFTVASSNAIKCGYTDFDWFRFSK
jgi:beta-xylosidase